MTENQGGWEWMIKTNDGDDPLVYMLYEEALLTETDLHKIKYWEKVIASDLRFSKFISTERYSID